MAWAIARDGDLWAKVYRALAARGWGSVRVRHVKGHREASEVAHDPKEARLKLGNDQADHYANKGREAHRNWAALLSWWEDNAVAYHKFYSCLQASAFAIFKEVVKSNADPLAKARKRNRSATVMAQAERTGDDFLPLARCQGHVVPALVTATLHDAIAAYLHSHEWAVTEVPACSMLQILADFCKSQYVGPLRAHVCKGLGQPTLATVLRAFRRAILDYVDGFVAPWQAKAFKNVKAVPLLQSLGFCSPVPALHIKPRWSLERASVVQVAVLSLRPGITPGALRQFALGEELQLTARPLKTDLPFPWFEAVAVSELPTAPSSFQFKCPGECGTIHTMASKPSSIEGWPKVWCNRCATKRRTGAAVCVMCLLQLKHCKCPCPTRPVQAAKQPPTSRQSTLKGFFASAK